MARKTFDDWKSLVEKQIASGLSVPQFCNHHDLSPNHFYSRKLKINNDSDKPDLFRNKCSLSKQH